MCFNKECGFKKIFKHTLDEHLAVLWNLYSFVGCVHQEIKCGASLQAFAKFCAFPSYTSSFIHSISKHLLSIHYMLALY